METLDPDYLSELARQFAGLSAFLGGFAATLLAQLLSMNTPRRSASLAILASAAAAICFVVAVLGTTMLIALVHPEAPAGLAALAQSGRVRTVAFAPFLAGVYLLLATVACAGWIRSPRMGWAATALAVTGGLLGGWTLVGV